ncbi:LPXTG-motif cell wall anchor domain-containing protein/TQXA domain-containing protein [Tindallia magadiensis]|uniref:LPXTG-motif cell wall anchor domain-containing protein/TQXA domain-containing protein n=1 Tax=Tindallia magadiensis TaxID=69895 RepID=A0A1I3AEW3_9FIRM|nr:Cys-Gln thioester bond-forming surface protein [Tindallia magadiensis]SFH47871.1 LPXTG-motif cell wall anchor domain-containing protein/TQXA domain-containing protein [Tindallia magadiensis]
MRTRKRMYKNMRVSIAFLLILLLSFGSVLPVTAIGDSIEHSKTAEPAKPERIEFQREVDLLLENRPIGSVAFELTENAFEVEVNLFDETSSQWIVDDIRLIGQLGGRKLSDLRETPRGSGIFLVDPWISETGVGSLSIAAEVDLKSIANAEQMPAVTFMESSESGTGNTGGDNSENRSPSGESAESDNNHSDNNDSNNDHNGTSDSTENDSNQSSAQNGSEDESSDTKASEKTSDEKSDDSTNAKDNSEQQETKNEDKESDNKDDTDENEDESSLENENDEDAKDNEKHPHDEDNNKEPEKQQEKKELDHDDQALKENEDKDQEETLDLDKENIEENEEKLLEENVLGPVILEEPMVDLQEVTAYTDFISLMPEEPVAMRQMGLMNSSTQYGYTGDGISGERISMIFTVREGTRNWHWWYGWQWTYTGPIFYVYCIDITTPLSTVEPYSRPTLASYSKLSENQKRRIVNMISHGYQVFGEGSNDNNLEDLRTRTSISNLTEQQAIAGTQYAIWRVTNGTQENRLSQNARDLRDYLLGLDTPNDISPKFNSEPSYRVDNGNLIIEFEYEGNDHDYDIGGGTFGSNLQSLMGTGVIEAIDEIDGAYHVTITQAINNLPENFNELVVRVKGVHYTSQGYVFEPVNTNRQGNYETQPLIDINIDHPNVVESVSIGNLEYRIEVEKHWSVDRENYSTEIESFDGRRFTFGLFDSEGEKINKDGSHWTITVGEEEGDSGNPAVFEPVLPGDYVIKEWIPTGADYDLYDPIGADNRWVEVGSVLFDNNGLAEIEAKNHQLFANLIVRKDFAPQHADGFGSIPGDFPEIRSMGVMEAVEEPEPEGFSFQLFDAEDNLVIVEGKDTFLLGEHNEHRMTFYNLPLGEYRAVEIDMPENYRWVSNGEIELTRSHVNASSPPEAVITNQELYEIEIEKAWEGTWLSMEEAGPFHFRIVRQSSNNEELSFSREKFLDPNEEEYITFNGLYPGTYHIYEEIPNGKPYRFSNSLWESYGSISVNNENDDWVLVGTVTLHDGQNPMNSRVAVTPPAFTTPRLIVTNEEHREISLEILKTVTGEGKPAQEEIPEVPFIVEVMSEMNGELNPPENGVINGPVVFMAPPTESLEGSYRVRDGETDGASKTIIGSMESPGVYQLKEIIPEELQGNYRLTGYRITYHLFNSETPVEIDYPANNEVFDPNMIVELHMVMGNQPVEKIEVEVFNEFFKPTLEVIKEYTDGNEEEVVINLYRVMESEVPEEVEEELIATETTEGLSVIFEVELGEVYRVEEEVPSGYTVAYPDEDIIRISEDHELLRVMNTKIPVLEVVKEYTDGNEEEVVINLYRVMESEVPEEVEEELITTGTTEELSITFEVEIGEVYRIEEIVPGGYTAEYPNGDTVEVGDIVSILSVVNTPVPAGGGGGGGGGGGTITPEIIDTVEIETTDPTVTIDEDPIPLGTPEEVIIDEDPVPLGVPEEPEEVIILDEEIPLGVPVLPQTGESNPLKFYILGFLLIATGYAMRKRITF